MLHGFRAQILVAGQDSPTLGPSNANPRSRFSEDEIRGRGLWHLQGVPLNQALLTRLLMLQRHGLASSHSSFFH